jgi:hypothetical protein
MYIHSNIHCILIYSLIVYLYSNMYKYTSQARRRMWRASFE